MPSAYVETSARGTSVFARLSVAVTGRTAGYVSYCRTPRPRVYAIRVLYITGCCGTGAAAKTESDGERKTA